MLLYIVDNIYLFKTTPIFMKCTMSELWHCSDQAFNSMPLESSCLLNLANEKMESKSKSKYNILHEQD